METLQQAGFSLWCDFIERDFLANGFKDLLKKGAIQGATSNPSIFANSILSSPIYQHQITALKGKKPKEIYETIAIQDIKTAALALRPLWEKDNNNGYISIEIDPFLGKDAPKSIQEGKRLFEAIDAPNVMIKIPATQAGYEVMHALYQDNIPINATLIFSPQQAKQCAAIFKDTPTKSRKPNHAVISVFVSRFDRALDPILKDKAPGLMLQAGVLNAMECYHLIEAHENPYTRTLFASTGVKDPHLPKDHYIKALLLPHCINTAPLESINAYLQSPTPALQPLRDKQTIHSQLQAIQAAGIDMPSLYTSLMEEGLRAFITSFETLLQRISS
ncbi:transaldolase [Helicobacter sp. 12S02634-8]|uniref:transaldolase n=1 Tax=Helicobacter sp. 12S02634-8 TaxID=1476199 RepID=UPI000BA5729A|nr:transaldolase [Helicobacter sp. 12S02634-8]PAF46781.1 transaldolase [Helicobacter sp. 12S02634-8]